MGNTIKVFVFSFLLICLISVSFELGRQVEKYSFNTFKSPLFNNNLLINNSENSIILNRIAEQCNKSTLSDTAKCINEIVNANFNYVLRDDDEVINYTTLFTEGGDCGNWADFYSDVADVLNINSKQVIIPTIDYTVHVFNVYFDSEGYCIIDQTYIHCITYGD